MYVQVQHKHMALHLQQLLDVQETSPTLIVDSRRCRYSSELSKEITRTDLSSVITVVDIGTLSGEEIQKISWLLGVPTLVSDGNVYLGVDAFSRSRELVRETFLK